MAASGIDVEAEFQKRLTGAISARYGTQFDPSVITTVIDVLIDLLTTICNPDMLPSEAIERTKKLSAFQRAALKSRMNRETRLRLTKAGMLDAKALAAAGTDAIVGVMNASTGQEHELFAEYVQSLIGGDDSWY